VRWAFGPGAVTQQPLQAYAVATVKAGWREGASIIVNSSRAVLYASSGADFAQAWAGGWL